MDRFTSNQDQNGQWSILHISSNTFSPVFRIVMICIYLGEPHVVVATWPCTYLFYDSRDPITDFLPAMYYRAKCCSDHSV